MPTYSVPTWNVWCSIWLPNNSEFNPPNHLSLCQLRHVRLNTWTQLDNIAGTDQYMSTCYILLPRGTDIRRSIASSHPFNGFIKSTRIAIPFDSTRIYYVQSWEDRAAGFPNEHRAAWCVRMPPDSDPVPSIYPSSNIIEPVKVNCDGFQWLAKRYKLVVAGMGGTCAVGGGSCSVLNGSWQMNYVSGCTWRSDPMPSCNAIVAQFAELKFNPVTPGWEVLFNSGSYGIASGAFNAWTPTVFPVVGVVGPCTYPASVTVEPME